MKLYPVKQLVEGTYSDTVTVAIYDSEEKAQEYIRQQNQYLNTMDDYAEEVFLGEPIELNHPELPLVIDPVAITFWHRNGKLYQSDMSHNIYGYRDEGVYSGHHDDESVVVVLVDFVPDRDALIKTALEKAKKLMEGR